MNVPVLIYYVVMQYIIFCPVSTVSFWLVFICYYLLYQNNLYYIQSSNIALGLVTKIVVYFYTEFAS